MLANVAGGLAELVLATLVTKLKIEAEHILFVVVEVDLVFDVFGTEEILGSTRATLKAIGTLPVALGNHDQLWLQTLIVSRLFADRAQHEELPLLRAVTLLTEDTVVAEPVLLDPFGRILRLRQAVRMERLSTQVAR